LLAAVERYLKLDHAERERYCEQVVANWNAALNLLPGVTALRDFPNEAGQPLPRSRVTVEAETANIHRDAVLAALLAGDPVIDVAACGTDSFYLNPMTLEPGEDQIVLRRLEEILKAQRG